MKKSYFLSLLFALFFVGAYAQTDNCLKIVAQTVRPICAPGETRVLTAAPPIGSVPKQTTSYTVTPVSFSWRSPDNNNDKTNIVADDKWCNVDPAIGGPYARLQGKQATTFNFCFYGEKYNKCLIGDNGVLTFGVAGDPDSPSGTYAPGGYCDWNISVPVPNANHIRNAIFGVYQDLYMIRFGTPPPAPAEINFFAIGAYPCRVFVANWSEVPLYSGSCSSTDLQSYQIVLFESTNIIEVHVKKRTSCTSWPTGINAGKGTIGIQDQTGNIGLAAPGRNADTFSVTNEAWRFTPSGANVSVNYHWYEVDATNTIINDLGVGQTKTVAPTAETRYRVDALFGTCDPAIPLLPASDFTTIKFGEVAINNPLDMVHCNSAANANQFTVGDNINTIYASSGLSLANTNAYIYTTLADAQDGFGNNMVSPISNDTAAVYTLPASETSHTLYIRVEDGLGGCNSIVPFTVSIIDCKIDVDVCDTGNNNTEDVNLLNYRPLIDTSNTADGLNPADYSITFHNSATDADNIATQITVLNPFTVVNGQDVYVRVQKIADPSSYIVKYLKVKLRPNPDVTITGTTEICAGATAPITITGQPGSVVNYTFNSTAQPSVTIPASRTITLTTPPVVSGNTYTYTVTGATYTDTDGYICSSPVPQSAIVTVGGLPTAAFTTTSTTICENDVITINVSGTAGTTVSYTENAGAVQTLLLDTLGQGTINMPTTLTPNTTYTYRLTKVSTASTPPCEQTLTDVVTITVSPNPTATITQIDSQVCLGNASSVKFSGTPNSIVTYRLNTNLQPTITIPASGEITFSETLPATGVFTYELVSVAMPAPSTCSQTLTGTVAITVVGLPTATISTAIPTICSGGNTVIDFSGTPNTTVYFKINGGPDQQVSLLPSTANPAIGEGTYTSPALTADTTYQLVKVVTTGTLSCETLLTGSVLVDVKPLPTATIQANQNICTGSSTTVLVTGTPNSTVTYTLNGGPATINLPINGSGTGTINTGTLTADATYRLVSVSLLDGITCQSTLNATSVVRVVALPTASFTALPNICSNRTAEITFTGTPNAQVNFTYTVGAVATSDSVTLNGSGGWIYTTIPITATTTFNLVSVVSAASGSIPSCSANIAGTLTITPTAAPAINFNPTPLEVCDDNTDGIALFNLALKNDEIIGAGSTLQITYHETQRNALDGVFPKYAPYENLVNAHPDQVPYIMWVRVQEVGGSACPSIAQLRLIVNRTPQPVSPDSIEICDDTTADGFATFPDLRIREAQMLAVLNPLDNYTFTYYRDEADASAAVPTATPLPVTNYTNQVAFSQTIWVRVANTITGCFKAVSLRLIVNPNPVIPAPGVLPEYTLCDVNNTGDGKEIFNLQSQIPLITTTPGMEVKFYFDDAAVAAGTPLLLNYENVIVPAQTIVAIVQNTLTGCTSRTTLTLRVKELPVIVIPAITPEICDADGNNAGQFDLDALIPEITGGAGYIVTFHETFLNAENNLFPYASPYENLASGIIFIRATDATTGCFSVAPLSLIVNPIPVVPSTPIDPLTVCDDNDDQIRRVDLQSHAEAILLPQPVIGNYDIKYFLTEADADQGTIGAIVTPANHLASNGDVVWVRITNVDTGCYNKISFEIIINPAVRFPSVEYALCDDGLPNNGFTTFNLTSQNQYFGGSNYTVAYYTLAGVLITTPNAYMNVNPGAQTLNVITTNNATSCESTSTLTIRVVPLPNPKLDPKEIVECDNDSPGDGLTQFDLTIRENYIRNLATNVSFFYYIDRNQAVLDGEQGTTFPNAIPTPTNFTSTVPFNQTIYVLVATNVGNPTAKSCYQIVELKLSVNPLPALGVNGVIKDFVACVVGSTGVHTFTLSDHNINVIASGLTPSDYTFTYYDSQVNAEGGTATGLLTNSYTNTSNPEPIWVRVVNNTTTCVNVGTFNLVVDEAAVANPVSPTEPLLTTCDNDVRNDGSTTFNLTPLNDIILGTPAPANFTIHYYDNEPDYLLDLAEGVTTANTRAIPDITNYITSTKDIIALVINRTSTTGCPARVDFTLTVNKLPEVKLEDGFFCLDPITNLPLNTFALTATVDPAAGNYTFEWTKDGAPYPVTDNTTNVIPVDQAGIYSVVVTNVDTGCISVKSDDVTVSPTSTAIATASVTGYFTDNATITVIVDKLLSLGEYEFRLDEGQWQDSNVFSPVATGDHLVQIRDKNAGGCDEFIPLTVTVINYPKFFTPNGDGIHDKWTILGLGDEARIYIFDRYGKLVKQISSDENGGWDGTMNGQMLPSTDYWFKVEYLENNVMKEFKAHFSLKR